MAKKKGLGRGLDALIGGLENGLESGARPLEVPLKAVSFNPLQPRSSVNHKDVQALSQSIRDKGKAQGPLAARAYPGNGSHYHQATHVPREGHACRGAGKDQYRNAEGPPSPDPVAELAEQGAAKCR